MLNYAEWIERFRAFCNRLQTIPGSEARSEIKKPLPKHKVDALAASLPLGLPSPLRHFLLEGSSQCEIFCYYRPSRRVLKQVTKLFSGPIVTILGGGVLCKAREFRAYQEACLDLSEWLLEAHPKDGRFWADSVPFIDLLNGDYVALFRGSKKLPVVYLDHDGNGYSKIIAPGFDEFLLGWEKLHYLNPDSVRALFVTSAGTIDTTSSKKQMLDKIFEDAIAE